MPSALAAVASRSWLGEKSHCGKVQTRHRRFRLALPVQFADHSGMGGKYAHVSLDKDCHIADRRRKRRGVAVTDARSRCAAEERRESVSKWACLGVSGQRCLLPQIAQMSPDTPLSPFFPSPRLISNASSSAPSPTRPTRRTASPAREWGRSSALLRFCPSSLRSL